MITSFIIHCLDWQARSRFRNLLLYIDCETFSPPGSETHMGLTCTSKWTLN